MEIKVKDLINVFMNFSKGLMVPLYTGAISDPEKYQKNVTQIKAARILLDHILMKVSEEARQEAKEYIEKEFLRKSDELFLKKG